MKLPSLNQLRKIRISWRVRTIFTNFNIDILKIKLSVLEHFWFFTEKFGEYGELLETPYLVSPDCNILH